MSLMCQQLADELPPTPQPLPGTPLSAPNAPSPELTEQDFARRVSNAWCRPQIAGNAISDLFLPDLTGITDLNALAHLGGFDHFNIEQDISAISGDQASLLLPRWTGVDPALGGNIFYQFNDQFPWYYEEVSTPYAWMPMYDDDNVLASDPSGRLIGLRWGDAPNIGPKNAGVVVAFTDYLVGVYSDHRGEKISDRFPNAQNVNFAWTLRQGHWGMNPHGRVQFARFDQREPGSKASVTFLGRFGSDPTVLKHIPDKLCTPFTEH
jgi:hypothetical protein